MRSSNMKQLPSNVILLFLALLLKHTQAQYSTLSCSRDPPEDQSLSPQYLCDVDITVIRNPDCTANITERYLFPYTTGRDAFRLIPVIEDQQNLTDVVGIRDNTTLFTFSRLQPRGGTDLYTDGGVLVNFNTLEVRQPVLFTLKYTLDPGVTRFTTACEGATGPPENETVNVLRWRAGFWEETFDKMRVSFSTTNNNASLSVASASNGEVTSSNKTSTIIEWKDVSTEERSIDVLVMERGTELCTEQLLCFREREEGAGGTPWFVIAILIVFVQIVYCCILCCKKRLRE